MDSARASYERLRARVERLPERRRDLLLAVFVGVAAVLEVFMHHPGPDEHRLVTAIASALFGVIVYWRRRFPIGVLVAAITVMIVQEAPGGSLNHNGGDTTFAVLLFLSYSAGVHLVGRRLTAAWAVSAALVFIDIAASGGSNVRDFVVAVVFLGAPMLAGRAAASRRELTRALRERTARLEAEQEQDARRAAEEERSRIAAELQDMIAHGVSAMAVQAGAARRLLDTDPEAASGAFAAVEETGRDALGEMRRLLGVLRRDDEDSLLAPQPSLRHPEPLVERAREQGLDVLWYERGERGELSPGADLAAYRVLEEALADAAARGAAGAEVVVAWTGQDLELRVEHDGEGARERERGVLGMRERLALYGGEVRFAREPSGHRSVRARMPVEGAVPA